MYTRSTGATRRSNAEAQAQRFAIPTGQDVTVETFTGMLISGPASYKGKGITRSLVLFRLNKAHDNGNLDDSFVIGGVTVTFSSIREVK